MERIQLAQVGKSIHNAIAMDAEGEYEQKNIPLNMGLQPLFDEFLGVVAAAAVIPELPPSPSNR